MDEQSVRFPDYLFGRINRAIHCLQVDRTAAVPQALNHRFDVLEHIKDRDIVHVTEFVSFYGAVGMYLADTGSPDDAARLLTELRRCRLNDGLCDLLESWIAKPPARRRGLLQSVVRWLLMRK
jgi:hypothetical protein